MTRLIANSELPEKSQIILICDAARALHVNRQTLFKKMKAQNLPVVAFSHRSRGLRLSDLNALIDAHLEPSA